MHVRAMYHVILTIPLAQYDLFLEKMHPSSRASELLMNGCFDQELSDGHLECKMQILCNTDGRSNAPPPRRRALP